MRAVSGLTAAALAVTALALAGCGGLHITTVWDLGGGKSTPAPAAPSSPPSCLDRVSIWVSDGGSAHIAVIANDLTRAGKAGIAENLSATQRDFTKLSSDAQTSLGDLPPPACRR